MSARFSLLDRKQIPPPASWEGTDPTLYFNASGKDFYVYYWGNQGIVTEHFGNTGYAAAFSFFELDDPRLMGSTAHLYDISGNEINFLDSVDIDVTPLPYTDGELWVEASCGPVAWGDGLIVLSRLRMSNDFSTRFFRARYTTVENEQFSFGPALEVNAALTPSPEGGTPTGTENNIQFFPKSDTEGLLVWSTRNVVDNVAVYHLCVAPVTRSGSSLTLGTVRRFDHIIDYPARNLSSAVFPRVLGTAPPQAAHIEDDVWMFASLISEDSNYSRGSFHAAKIDMSTGVLLQAPVPLHSFDYSEYASPTTFYPFDDMYSSRQQPVLTPSFTKLGENQWQFSYVHRADGYIISAVSSLDSALNATHELLITQEDPAPESQTVMPLKRDVNHLMYRNGETWQFIDGVLARYTPDGLVEPYPSAILPTPSTAPSGNRPGDYEFTGVVPPSQFLDDKFFTGDNADLDSDFAWENIMVNLYLIRGFIPPLRLIHRDDVIPPSGGDAGPRVLQRAQTGQASKAPRVATGPNIHW